jgi:hypothetical protein
MSVAPVVRTTGIALEARSVLDAWVRAELPAPPTPKGLGWLGVGQDGETHFREVKVSLTPTAATPPAQPYPQSTLQSATTIRHVAFEPHWGIYDRDHGIFHNASSARFVTIRHGVMWLRASDGETRQFRAGDVVEVLDVAPSKGHITWIGDEPVIALFFQPFVNGWRIGRRR